MNKIVVFLFVLIVCSCNRTPFVNHKLKFEKVSDNCSEQQAYFRMISNFGGERYEFEKCLAADFNDEQISSERKGDTVLINFKKAADGKPAAVFHITLDIDSYPPYRFLTIDEDTYTITPSQK